MLEAQCRGPVQGRLPTLISELDLSALWLQSASRLCRRGCASAQSRAVSLIRLQFKRRPYCAGHADPNLEALPAVLVSDRDEVQKRPHTHVHARAHTHTARRFEIINSHQVKTLLPHCLSLN